MQSLTASASVSGTNGKTTTTHLIAHLLRAHGWRTGTIGTLGAVLDGVGEVLISHTTPEAPEIQHVLYTALQNGVQAVAMEASSHALDQNRTLGLEFDVAVFTNLTQDHLDYHQTLEAYRAAKLRLFDTLLPAGAAAVVECQSDPRVLLRFGDPDCLQCESRR